MAIVNYSRTLAVLLGLAGLAGLGPELHAQAPGSPPIEFTAAERSFIQRHPVIRHGYEPDWPPFEFLDESGAFSGVAADYLRYVERHTGLVFEAKPGLTWSQTMAQIRSREIDLVPVIAETPERREYALFTQAYIDYPIVIVTRTDAPFVGSLNDLNGQVVSVPRKYYTADLLLQDYPDIRLLYTDSMAEALRRVALGDADASIDNLAVMSQHIYRLGLTNLKIAAPTEYRSAMGFGVRKDWPELRSILDKTLANMTEAERNAIYQKWIPVRYEYGIDMETVLRTAGLAALAVIAVLGLFWLWNRSLEKEVQQRKAAETELSRVNGELIEQRNQLSNALRTIQRDIGLARVIQRSMLPPDLEGFQNARVAARYRPMSEIGGDIYDVFEVEPGLLRVFLADAMGHGVQAALITMTIKSEYENLKLAHQHPEGAVAALNTAMMHRYASLPIYFPCIVADIDSVDGKLRYCSAGLSDQLLLRRSGERLRLRRSGPMIGLSTQIPFSGEERDFGPGDVLLFFSDGLTEAHDARDAMYGDDRLISVATARRLDGPAAIIADLERDWERFLGDAPAQDDFTMIAVERAIPVPPDAESEAESAPQAGGAARLDVNQDGG